MRYHRFLLLLGTGGKTCLAGLYIVPYLCIHSWPVRTDSGPPKAPLYTDVGRVYSLNHVFPQLEGNNNSFSPVNNAVLYSKLITKVEEWSTCLLHIIFLSFSSLAIRCKSLFPVLLEQDPFWIVQLCPPDAQQIGIQTQWH